ncbi:MAG: hypothetical protein ACXWKC_19460, partial [Xanthobacteraceae bacterium]
KRARRSWRLCNGGSSHRRVQSDRGRRAKYDVQARHNLKSLYELYIAFGPDPFVVPFNPKDPDVEFSAWTYAMEQSEHLVRLRG